MPIDLKRASISVIVAALSTFSGAQPLSTGQGPANIYENNIWSAYQNLRGTPLIQLSLSGTSTIGRITSSFAEQLYFATGVDTRTGQTSRAYVELDDYDTNGKAPILLHRYVGDGQNLWSYDFVNYRYSATFYSFYGSGANLPADYPGSDAPRMLAQLYAISQGPASYMARLMRELNPNPNPNLNDASLVPAAVYESWAPGYTPGTPPTAPPTQDPLVPTWLYSSSSSLEWVLYGPYNVKPTRSVGFQLTNSAPPDQTPIWNLTSINFAETGKNYFDEWTMQVSTPLTVPTVQVGGSSIFTPIRNLSGWQPIALRRPYSG